MEKNSKQKSLFWWRLPLVIILPFVLIGLVLAVLSSHDQVRPVTVSDNTFEPLLNSELIQRVKESARQTDGKEAKAALLEIARNNFPWPKTASLPAEQQAEARRYEEEICEWLVECLTFNERTRRVSQNVAVEELLALMKRMDALDLKYKNILSRFTRAERFEMFIRRNAFYCAANTGIYVDRGSWITAAQVNMDNWDKVTYYLRRGGIKGRLLLAVWSLQRRIQPDLFK